MRKIFNKPGEIEEESMRIIEGELRNSPSFHIEEFSGAELSVIKRGIHASADFEFAENIRFVGDVGEVLPDVSAEGVLQEPTSRTITKTVISDTNMILAGVSKPALSKLAMEAVCFMGEPEMAKVAKEKGITRAVASMERAVSLYPEGIYLIGNAPTALIRLCELIEEGKARPSLVVGVPVGFVNVVESKEYALSVCSEHGVPTMISMGRKGGSTIAVAAMNALLYRAAGR